MSKRTSLICAQSGEVKDGVFEVFYKSLKRLKFKKRQPGLNAVFRLERAALTSGPSQFSFTISSNIDLSAVSVSLVAGHN